MAVLRVAHVWGDRLLDVRHFAGDGAFGPLIRSKGRIRMADEAIAVREGEVTRVSFGATTLQLEYVDPQPRPAAVADDRDWAFFKWTGGLLVAAAALVAMFMIDVQLGFADDDRIASGPPTRLSRLLPPPPPPKKKPEREKAPTADEARAQKRAQHELAPRPAKKLEAKSAGLLGALDALKGAEAVFAPTGLSADVAQGVGNLKGAAIGNAQGLSFGAHGPGGPGGTDFGSIGGNGFTRRPGGDPNGTLTHKPNLGPCCVPAIVTGGLSKELVGKVIRRHFNEIRFCYEQALQQKPELAGKLSVLFTIDASGSVSEADVAESSLEEPNVEACVLARVRRWKFPEPTGGGVVSVTHPWFFKPAGSEE